jgi:hypothetical protein
MTSRLLLAAALGASLAATPALAQEQRVDPNYKPQVDSPAYAPGSGPLVAIDAGHANVHTAGTRYAPFAALLGADGYQVHDVRGWAPEVLAQNRVLVISNMRRAPSDAEADALRDWVQKGGSLLLIADHAPYGTVASDLAARFGVEMGKGYVVVSEPGGRRLSTTIDYRGPTLGHHPIVAGRNNKERVRQVTTFTGQSLSIPEGATALLRLEGTAVEVADADTVRALAQGEHVSGRKVGARAQGVALPFGKGRVVIVGEAAMFSAQISVQGTAMGMNASGNDDRQFALNTLHWLSRAPGMAD